MNEKEFGKLIEKLIYFSGQKNYSLATELGYDVSYISKWINSTMLPSAKNIKNIIKITSNFIVDSSSDSSLDDMINYFEIDLDKKSDKDSRKPSSDAKHYLSDIIQCDYTGKRVLLVEDNDLNSEIAKEIIGMTGAEVVTAENGKTAVDMISSGNAFAEDVQLARSAGMNEHISKPLDMTRLRDVMRKWL